DMEAATSRASSKFSFVVLPAASRDRSWAEVLPGVGPDRAPFAEGSGEFLVGLARGGKEAAHESDAASACSHGTRTRRQ
ncbi:MAG: hypothetical protein D6790_16350, partial [Caldilineae bacterium]